MASNIHGIIKNEYERRQKEARDKLDIRRDEVYSKIPRIPDIEMQIRMSSIKHNKLILSGCMDEESKRSYFEEIYGLSKEKEMLLKSEGYPADYLSERYICSMCSDTGLSGGKGPETCSCYKQLLIDAVYKSSNLQITKVENFSAFDERFYPDTADEKSYGIKISPRQNILMIKDACIKFIEGLANPETKNLFFTGKTGAGKTFMSNCVAAEILSKGYTVLYQTAPMMFAAINEYRFKASKSDDVYTDLAYKSIFDTNLLIIDDLGTEPQSAARYTEFLNILNMRYMDNLKRPCKTIISTNLGVRSLYEYYTERVASRIISGFDMYRFAGNDIRVQKGL